MAATLALLLFAGEVLRPFAWVMTFGVFTATFSSIYVASPLLLWVERKFPRAVRQGARLGGPGQGSRPPTPRAPPAGYARPATRCGRPTAASLLSRPSFDAMARSSTRTPTSPTPPSMTIATRSSRGHASPARAPSSASANR
ncbi:MAG: hypothetical protein IPF47_07085 [Gemmatimonadetes bacterium]|nr:hypothetical protein [Gemmatimonadota bacterium]